MLKGLVKIMLYPFNVSHINDKNVIDNLSNIIKISKFIQNYVLNFLFSNIE